MGVLSQTQEHEDPPCTSHRAIGLFNESTALESTTEHWTTKPWATTTDRYPWDPTTTDRYPTTTDRYPTTSEDWWVTTTSDRYPTETTTDPRPNSCSSPLVFERNPAGSSNSQLFCYNTNSTSTDTDTEEEEIFSLPVKEDTVISGGTTCVYMSEGNLHEGVVMEMFCDG